MKKLITTLMVVLPISGHADPINMRPGLWEFKNDMGPSQKACYTKDDLKSLDSMLQSAAKKGGTICRWFDIHNAGNTWTYKQACKYGSSPEMLTEVKNTFNGESAEMVLSSAGNTFTSKGKWLGVCK